MGNSCTDCGLAQYIREFEAGKRVWVNRHLSLDGQFIELPEILSLFSWYAGYSGRTDAGSLKRTLNWLLEHCNREEK